MVVRGSYTNWVAWALPVVFGLYCTAPVRADVFLNTRTADMPDSWMLLYNVNDPDSLTWLTWYQQQWGIPTAHAVGLSTSTGEHLPDLATVQAEIISPVRDFLANNPQIEQKVMGIILGYGMPGHYAQPEIFPNTGGYSIADALQDMNDDGVPPISQKDFNLDTPHLLGNVLPPDGRLTKGAGESTDMASGRYMVARIDGPTLADAMDLTNRAKALACGSCSLYGEEVAYDYYDPNFPVGLSNEWYWLKAAVEAPELADLPWQEFDLDGVDGNVQPENDAFRFSIYKLYGWSSADFASANPGSQVLAFHFNSFGAVTIRSCTNQGALFVPNALAAGYAAAIGATGEPGDAIVPFPDTLLAALQEGWTLGEAYYLSNPYNDFMWNLVGDPFLTVPNWFDDQPSPVPGDGDMNGDGFVNGLDIPLLTKVFSGEETDPGVIAIADLDGSGTIDDDDLFLFFGPILHESYDPDVLRGSGDANGDGRINGDDITVFVDALFYGVDSGAPLRIQFAPDMDQDGQIDMDDLPLFVSALLGQ